MKDVKEITDKLEQGVKDLFASEGYADYLRFMGKFHNYSANNSLLIFMQKPDATLVAGYQTWKNKFRRQVRKGETGIVILAPCPRKFIKRRENEDGSVDEEEIKYTTFRAVSVFDISQTDGDPIPESPCRVLRDDVEGYEAIIERLISVSPVRVGFEDIRTGANGYFHRGDERIAIKVGMPQAQTIKTLVHEIAHAMIHCVCGSEENVDRFTKEVQAESVAFTVCDVLGLDTSDYSFGYIAGWSTGKEAKELAASVEVIRATAGLILEGLG